MKTKLKVPGRAGALWTVLFFLLPVLCGLFSLCVGRMSLSPADVAAAIGAKLGMDTGVSPQTATVVWSMRMPRILLSALVGAGLSAAGCAFQSLFANPLATPDTLGVASGASFGAVLALLFGFGLVGVQLTALGFGLAAVGLTELAGWKRNTSRTTVVLAGIMIGSLFSALISLVKYTADTESQLPAITYWLMGGMQNAGYQNLVLGAPLIVLGIIVLMLLRWRLNLLPLSDDEARTAGVNIRALRTVTVLCATAMTASCVSMCGQVGWVGLLVPHICRMKFGNNHLSLLPASVSIGACFLILVDTAARSVTASEIPISILTAILGAPFFLILMRRGKGWSL